MVLRVVTRIRPASAPEVSAEEIPAADVAAVGSTPASAVSYAELTDDRAVLKPAAAAITRSSD